MSRSRWIGGDPAQWEIERLADLKCQISDVHDESDAHFKRKYDSVEQLAFVREQLLALSIIMYERALTEELAGNYEIVEMLHNLAADVRDIRVNKTVDRLSAVKAAEKGKP
jgi:hypothetical protein